MKGGSKISEYICCQSLAGLKPVYIICAHSSTSCLPTVYIITRKYQSKVEICHLPLARVLSINATMAEL